MSIETDGLEGKAQGSHIRLHAKVLGIELSVDEAVIEYRPPERKAWRTTGVPRLLVIGEYTMGFEIKTEGAGSLLRVFIDYELPRNWIGRWFPVVGKWYARWCTQQMASDAATYFSNAVRHQ